MIYSSLHMYIIRSCKCCDDVVFYTVHSLYTKQSETKPSDSEAKPSEEKPSEVPLRTIQMISYATHEQKVIQYTCRVHTLIGTKFYFIAVSRIVCLMRS